LRCSAYKRVTLSLGEFIVAHLIVASAMGKAKAGGEWSGCPDLNRGPLAPHASALTKLRYTPTEFGGTSDRRKL
jgi:hypothetical protein